MKKRILSLILIAVAFAGNVFAAKLPTVKPSEGLFIYRVVINKDINRQFYAETLNKSVYVNQPHTSGDLSSKVLRTQALLPFTLNCTISTQPVGEFTCLVLDKKSNLNSSFAYAINVFGTEYCIAMPASNNKDAKLSFDKSQKYFYLGTFVYDFIDGTDVPVLKEVRDEFDDAEAWLKSFGIKKATLYRAELQ